MPALLRGNVSVIVQNPSDVIPDYKVENLGVDPAPLTGKAYLEILEKGYIEMGRAIKAANLPKISG